MAKSNKSESGSPPKPDAKKSPKKTKETKETLTKKEAKNGVTEAKKVTKKVTKGSKSSTSIFNGKLLIGASILVVLLSVGVYVFVGHWQDEDSKLHKIKEYSFSELIDQGIKTLFSDEETKEEELEGEHKYEQTSEQVKSEQEEESSYEQDEETQTHRHDSETDDEESFKDTRDSEETDKLVDSVPTEENIPEVKVQENESESEIESEISSKNEPEQQYVDPLESLETEQEKQEIQTESEGDEEKPTREYESLEPDTSFESKETENEETQPIKTLEEKIAQHQENIDKIGDIKASEYYKVIGDTGKDDYKDTININHVLHRRYKTLEGDYEEDLETPIEYEDDENNEVSDKSLNDQQETESKTESQSADEDTVENDISSEFKLHDNSHSEKEEELGEEFKPDDVIAEDSKDENEVKETEDITVEIIESKIDDDEGLYTSEEDSQIVINKSDELEPESDLVIDEKELEQVDDSLNDSEEVIKDETREDNNEDNDNLENENLADQDTKSQLDDQVNELRVLENGELSHVDDEESSQEQDDQQAEDFLENQEKTEEFELDQNQDVEQTDQNDIKQNDESLVHEEEQLEQNDEILRKNEEALEQNDEELEQNYEELEQNEGELEQNEEIQSEMVKDEEELEQDETLVQDEEALEQNEEELEQIKEGLEQNEDELKQNEELEQNEKELKQNEEELEQNEEIQSESVKDEEELIKDQNDVVQDDNLHEGEEYSEYDEDDFIRKDEIQDEERVVQQDENLNEEEIDEGLKEIELELSKGARDAVNHYHTKLLHNINDNFAALGKARALTAVWKKEGIKTILEDARDTYLLALGQKPLSKKLSYLVASECVELMEAANEPDRHVLIMDALSSLLIMYPDDLETFYELATTSLEEGRLVTAKTAFQLLLDRNPFDPLARLRLGSILKTVDRDFETAVDLMLPVVAKGEVNIEDPTIFLDLGDALNRLGRKEEAKHVYYKAVDVGLLQSPWQHNIITVPGLINKAWWSKDELSDQNQRLFAELENYWFNIREEVVKAVEDGIVELKQLEDELIEVEKGGVEKISLFVHGNKNNAACDHFPATCRLVENIPDVVKCQQCEAQIYIIQPNTRLTSYISPTNARIRADLGLSLAEDDLIIVRGEKRSWKLGQLLFYDPSFDREWITGDKEGDDTSGAFSNQVKSIALPGNRRAILTLDFWHPELNDEQKEELEEL